MPRSASSARSWSIRTAACRRPAASCGATEPGWNVGRNDSPDDPRYGFLRDADYVSGAALLIRRELFERAGGFSETFAPAYYEDVDLCFSVRALGYRVVYQPRSVVVHYDGVTAGDERSGVKRFQEINRPKFREKWAAELEYHLENDSSNVATASRRRRARTILVVDSYVPLYDREAGSQRIYHIVSMLAAAGCNVIFLPDNYAPMEPYTSELQQMGVEVLHHVEGGRTLHEVAGYGAAAARLRLDQPAAPVREVRAGRAPESLAAADLRYRRFEPRARAAPRRDARRSRCRVARTAAHRDCETRTTRTRRSS